MMDFESLTNIEHFKIGLVDVLSHAKQTQNWGFFGGRPLENDQELKLKNGHFGIPQPISTHSTPQTFCTRNAKQIFLGSRTIY